MANFRTQTAPDAVAWAAKAREVYNKQIEKDGKTSYTAAVDSLRPESSKLSEAACARIKKDGKLTDDSHGMDVAQASDVLVADAFVSVAMEDPKLLMDLGFTTVGKWPPFMLTEPAASPETPVGDVGGFIAKSIRSEFQDGSGSIKVPDILEPSFEQFRTWYRGNSENPLTNRASVTGAPIRTDVLACLP